MNIKRNSHRVISIMIGIAILAACGTQNHIPTISPSPIQKSTFVPQKKITPTPKFTETMEPTLAYWATAQENKFNANDTQVAETQATIYDLATQFPQLCGFGNQSVLASPNGNWIASDCRFAGDFFRVFQTNGSRIWDIPYSAIFKFYPEFLGSVEILHWSTNGKHLYFAENSCCADTDATTNGDNLYKLDLETGDWVLVISGTFNYYSFSPDGKSLIYILNNQASANETLDLHLLNTDSGKEEIINVGNFERGRVVWKKDGQKISVITQVGNLIEENSKYSLVSVDLQNKQVQTIILNTQNWLDIKDWSNDDILTISQTKAVDYNGYYINVSNVVFYDLKTNLFITPPTTQ